MAETILWMNIGAIVFAYFGYPVVISVLSLFWKNDVKTARIEPFVTFLITAYNEEKNLREKIENTLSLDYPKEKLEILVASDGSTDGTDEIAKEFSEQGVVLLRVEGRVGKTETQNQAVQNAKGEIILFSDATTHYRGDAIRNLVKNYNDPSVGAVSGRYEYVNPTGGSVGFGTILFWKYENFVKSRQTRIRTITGCCGCIYSVRKALYEPLPRDIISDLVEPLKILEKGHRIAFEPNAVAYEVSEEKPEEELSMRVRVITRGMNGLMYVRNLLNPLKHPFVSFQLISHKIFRWLIPVFLFVIFVSNLMVLDRGLYGWMFILQIGFYSCAFTAWVMERYGRRVRILFVPLYFCIVNIASVMAILNLIRGRKMVVWETVRK